jgi:CheY-like chemotaxis protein
MWEKIVLNLVSNAFKFTLQGEIAVGLRAEAGEAVLTVTDTGVGIPEAELPRVFERFHRIEQTQARTHEGTGIGLALVQELVKLHGGSIDVTSRQGEGTAFTVRLPFGAAHLPPERVREAAPRPAASGAAQAFVEEALRWLPRDQQSAQATESGGGEEAAHTRPCIVLADDNADMRAYVSRLLDEAGYDVIVAGDGESALAAVRRVAPVLVLSDVMMPCLDGLGLATALRADPSKGNAKLAKQIPSYVLTPDTPL